MLWSSNLDYLQFSSGQQPGRLSLTRYQGLPHTHSLCQSAQLFITPTHTLRYPTMSLIDCSLRLATHVHTRMSTGAYTHAHSLTRTHTYSHGRTESGGQIEPLFLKYLSSSQNITHAHSHTHTQSQAHTQTHTLCSLRDIPRETQGPFRGPGKHTNTHTHTSKN